MVYHGDGTISSPLASKRLRTPHLTGGLPRHGVMKQQAAISGYGGHVAGKVAENLHGGSLGEENERASMGLSARDSLFMSLSSPELHRSTLSSSFTSSEGSPSPKRGFIVAPRIPGFRGHVPGKLSENVHGFNVADANSTANSLRHYNPHANSECWLRKGEWPVDRQMTYKWRGRAATTAMQDHFTNEEQVAMADGNRRLGYTFGMNAPPANRHKPGDRYLHLQDSQVSSKKTRIDPTKMGAAGQSSYSTILDDERRKQHFRVNVTCSM